MYHIRKAPLQTGDCAPMFRSILENVRDNTVIQLEPGEYHFWPEGAAKRRWAISNTDTARGPAQSIGLLLEGKSGLWLSGTDTTLVIHGCQMAVGIKGCEDIRLSGIAIQYACPPAADVTVVESDGRSALVSYPAPLRCEIRNGQAVWLGEEGTQGPYWEMTGDMDLTQHLRGGRVRRTAHPMFEHCGQVEALPGRRLRLHYRRERDVRPGDVFQMRRTRRDSCGMFIGNSRNIALEDLRIGYLYAMGIVCQCSRGLTFSRIDFKAAGEGRHSASGADCLHCSGCGGRILIEGCTFVNPHDDPVNIHGAFLELLKLGGSRVRLSYRHPQTAGFRSVFPGDVLELFDQQTLLPVGGRYRALQALGPDPAFPDRMEALLDAEPPEGRLVAENVSWVPEVEIRGCDFRQCPTRAILLTTRGKTVIEGNRFSHVEMAAVSISCDAADWYESGPVRDVVIRGNMFADCQERALLVCPTNTVHGVGYIHRNIRFVGNRLARMPTPAVSLRSAADVVVEGNLCDENKEGGFIMYDHSAQKAAEEYRFHCSRPEEPQALSGFGSPVYGINRRYLTKNGRPWLPVSGELHYSRLQEDAWGAALDKMKRAGIGLVSTYVFWIHHEEIEHEFRWDGNLDLGRFIDLCHARGLGVCLRIGPWAHGECRNGGHPDWLIAKCGGRVRRDAEPYLTLVREFYNRIATHLKGRELFSIQIENELVNNAAHLETLCKMAKECGLNAPFMTATGWSYDTKEVPSLLPAFGGYPEQPWNQSMGPSSPNPHFFFTGIRDDGMIGTDLLPRSAAVEDGSVPYFTCEIGPGVQCYEHRRPLISAEDALSMEVTTIGGGCNWLGLYMFHGGSNPMGKLSSMEESQASGYPNNCPAISYDFQAPIGECGQLRDSYFRLKSFHSFLNSFGDRLAPMIPAFPDRRPSGLDDMETLRCCVRSDGQSGFLFVNNHHHGKRLPEHGPVKISVSLSDAETCFTLPCVPADASFAFPIQMPLVDGLVLAYAFAQPLAKKGGEYWFQSVEGIPPLFQFSTGGARLITGTENVGGVTIHVEPFAIPPKPEPRPAVLTRISEDEWRLSGLPKDGCIAELDFYGNRAAAYNGERLVADQYYYGEPWKFRVPAGCESICVRISPLLAEDKVYMECEKKLGAAAACAGYYTLEAFNYGK